MSRRLKIAAWSTGGLLGLLVLLVGAIFVIGNTDGGRAWVIRLTAQLTQGHVRLAGIQGSFPAALDLERLELSDDEGVWLFAEHISLRWSPSALLGRHVQVQSLHVAKLHVERAPLPDKNPKPSSNPSVPNTDVADLSINTLELGEKLAGAPTSLTVHGNAHLKSLQDATAHILAQRSGGDGTYEIQVQFDPDHMNAMLSLKEPANGPLENLAKVPTLGDLAVMARLSGPRTAEKVELSVDAGPLRARAAGTVDLTGESADLTYSLTAPKMAPYPGVAWQSVDLQGRFHGPFKTPVADGRLLIEQLQAPGGTQLARLEADLTADASGLMTLKAALDRLVIPGPQPDLLQDSRLTLDGSIRLNDAQRPVQLSAKHRLFELQASGNIAAEQSVQLKLRIPEVAPFAALGGQKIKGAANAAAHIQHTATATALSADVNADIDPGNASWAGLVKGGNTRLQLTGNLTDEKISIDRLQLNGRAIALTADGKVARTGEQAVDARLNLDLPNLANVSPALAGDLKMTAKVKGPTTSLSANTELTSNLSVHGSPRGKIEATIDAADLPREPRGTITAAGDLDGSPLQLKVLLNHVGGSQDYHVVIQQADWKSAHADGDITAGTDVAQSSGNLRLRMTQLADLDRLLASNLKGNVAGTVAITPSGGKPRAKIQLDARDVESGGVTTNAQLTAEGTPDALDIKLAAQSPAVGGEPLSLDTQGQLNLTAHELRLNSLQTSYHSQEIKLLQPAKLLFADGLAVSNLKIGAQGASIEADGTVSPALNLHAAVRDVKPELINAFVPKLLAGGKIDADARLQGSLSAPTGQVKLDAVGVRASNDAAQGLPPTDLHANADLMGTVARVDAKLTAGNASHLGLTGTAPLAAGGKLDMKLAGNVDANLLNPLLEAKGRHVTGDVVIDTTVTGPTANPEIGGTVKLTKGSFRDYTQGVNLSDITGDLSGGHGLLKVEQLTARAAPGDITIQGTIGVLQPKMPVDLTLTAKNAQPIASNIVTANLDADIKVTGTASEQLSVDGTVKINRADVEIPSGLPPNVAVLNVTRPGKAAPPPPEKPLVIKLGLTVDAPRQILVKGRGLDAEMGGQLRIRGTTDTPTVGGAFELQRGFFTLASSKLTFSSGTVTFSGAGLKNRIDPTLDFVASSQVVDTVATVKITGQADSPKIELSSTPELPQDEILARLLFGQSASQLTALQVVQIGYALSTLGGGGGGGFNPVAKVQKALGLDRLSVGGASNTNTTGSSSQTTNGASVEAGRYISNRVYVGVKESTTGASQVGVDVDLTKRLKLQAKLGNGQTTAQGTTPENDPGSSLGIAYQFEY